MRGLILSAVLGLSLTCGVVARSEPEEGGEQPGAALERLGARTGSYALATMPYQTDGPKAKLLQRQNKYAYVVIGTDWKGGREGLKYLQALPGLRGVNFTHPDFCDGWAECLREVKDLKEVYVHGRGFTDRGMRSLRHLKGLEALSLLDTGVTDEGLACLEGMAELRYLSLAGTDVTDAGLAHLRGMKHLRRLNLDCSSTTGAGMAHLKDATELEWLRLSGLLVIHEERPDARLASASLRHLHGMKGLKYLSIGSMQTTEAEMEALMRAVKGLERIESTDGVLTRDGWKDPEDIRDKLQRVLKRIEERKSK
jgi:hypothetical protein